MMESLPEQPGARHSPSCEAQTSVTWYYANLSLGETSLSMAGPDTTLFQGDWTGASQIGVGNFLNGSQEFLEGNIDNAALINEALDQATLQTHLDAIYIPEPGTLGLLALAGGIVGLLRRRK